MRPRLRRALLGAALVAVTAWTGTVPAQTNDEVNTGIQFNFSTPGARSLGMGGAFLAFADDATAAYSNPAGLTHLIYGGSEASAEIRSWQFDARFPDRGRDSGTVANVGVDTLEGLEFDEEQSMEQGLSFLSAGHVLEGGIAVAVYRHKLADFTAQFQSEGLFFAPSGGTGFRTSPIDSSLHLEILNYGLSAGWEKPLGEVGEAGISLGLGVSYYTFELDSVTERFTVANRTDEPDVDRLPGGFFGPPDRLGDNVHSIQRQNGSDEGWGVVAGLLWKIDPLRRWNVGAVYRHAPEFDVVSSYTHGLGAQRSSDGAVQAGQTVPSLGGEGTFVVPEFWGVGLGYNDPQRSWRASVDVNYLRYSEMAEDLTNLLLSAQSVDGFEVDDGIDVHLGLEYVTPLTGEGLMAALRGGIWHEAAHKLHYTGQDPRLRVRFPEGEDDLHLAAGFGLAIGESIQIDVGADWGDLSQTTSVSLIWFF